MTFKPGPALAAYQRARKGKGVVSPSRNRPMSKQEQAYEKDVLSRRDAANEKRRAARSEAAGNYEPSPEWQRELAERDKAAAPPPAEIQQKDTSVPWKFGSEGDNKAEDKTRLANNAESRPGFGRGVDVTKQAPAKSFKPQSPEQYAKGTAAAAADKKRGEDPNFHGTRHAEHIKKSDEHMDAAREARRTGNDHGYRNHMDAAASHDQAAWAHRESYRGQGSKLAEKAKEASADANKVSQDILTGSRGGRYTIGKGGGKRYGGNK